MTGGPGLGHKAQHPHKQKFVCGGLRRKQNGNILFVCLLGGRFDLGKRLF